MRVLGVSVRVPLRVRGLSVCVHVVIGCVRGSSQGGWRLRFGRRLLVSALVEQHVGRFSLREEEGTVTRQKHTPDADTWHWGAAVNAPECRKLSDREECSPQSDPLKRRTRCCHQSNTTFHPLYSCRKLCLFRQRRSRMSTCLLYNPRSKIQQVHWIFFKKLKNKRVLSHIWAETVQADHLVINVCVFCYYREISLSYRV